MVAKLESQSFWTDGVSMWSYATCIATPHPDKVRAMIVNTTKYSKTTTRKQKELLQEYRQQRITVYEVTDIRINASANVLVTEYNAQYSQ
jgi:hypothetical protein